MKIKRSRTHVEGLRNLVRVLRFFVIGYIILVQGYKILIEGIDIFRKLLVIMQSGLGWIFQTVLIVANFPSINPRRSLVYFH